MPLDGCNCFTFAADDPAVRKYGLGAAAIRYARMGFSVLPLDRGGKRPHQMLGDRGGVHRASDDEDQVKEWWSYDMAANVGVATGSPSALLVIDLDVKGGKDGGRELWAMMQRYGLALPGQVTVASTPSGGRHIWLQFDGPVPERPGILPGVDVKGDGGLIVAPPSMRLVVPADRSGGTTGEVPVPYSWVRGCPHYLNGCPPWVARWLAWSQAQPGANRESDTVTDQSLDIEDYLAHGIPAGSRNRETYRVACSLYRKLGTDPQAAERVMADIRAIWMRTDHSGFGWNEVLTCLASARRFVEQSRQREEAGMDAIMRGLRGAWK